MFEFRLRFHWSLFPRAQSTIFQHWLIQIMAWRRPGDKPLSEPMMVSLPTPIHVTRPKWVNDMGFCVRSAFVKKYNIQLTVRFISVKKDIYECLWLYACACACMGRHDCFQIPPLCNQLFPCSKWYDIISKFIFHLEFASFAQHAISYLNQWWSSLLTHICITGILRPRKWIFLNGKWYSLIQIYLKFVPMGPINNNQALVQIMT